MGIYTRKDSPFYWMLLERRDRKGLRESTRVLLDAPSQGQRRDQRDLAQSVYARRMSEIAREDLLLRETNQRVVSIARPPLTRSLDGWCYLYFVQREDLVKIGKAVDVEARIRSLQTAHPSQLLLLAAVPCHAALEGAVQRRFAHLRARAEWFYLEADLVAFIKRLKAGENPVAVLFES